MSTRLSGLLLVSLVACADAGGGRPGGNVEVTPGGKADDYLSPIAQEYDFRTPVRITLTGDDASLIQEERLYRARELAAARMDELTAAVDAKIWDVWKEEDRYGDQAIVLRVVSGQIDGLRPEGDADYVFDYLVEAGGPRDLLARFPFERRDGVPYLAVNVGDTRYDLAVSVSQATPDSYPQYLDLFAGGLDVAIHIGDDHEGSTADQDQAANLFDHLVESGFTAPVARFADLKLDSGPFTAKLPVEGLGQVDVRVSVYTADMAPDDQLSKLVDAYKASARSADVVIYAGHAGRQLDYSGVVLHYGPRAAIPASEFKNLELPAKYQIFVFDGCETYVGYSDKMFDHAGKTSANLDVITTVNYSANREAPVSLYAILAALTERVEGTWVPRSWEQVLGQVNAVDEGAAWTAMYGVHGLSDNPQLSPLAQVATIGQSCDSDAACPGIDGLCVTRAGGERECGVACTSDAACGAGNACTAVDSAALGAVRQCLTAK